MDFNFDPEAIAAQQDEQAKEKQRLALLGGVGDALASENSFGNYYLGRLNAPSDRVSKTLGAVSDTMQDPSERQAKLYELAKRSQEAKNLNLDTEMNSRKRDPNSNESKSLKVLAPRWGINVTPDMSAADIEQMIDPKKMMETEAASKVTYDREKSLRQMDHNYSSAEKEKDRRNDLEKATLKRQLDEADKNLPQNVYTAATYGRRVEDANKQMNGLLASGYDPTTVGQSLQKSAIYPERFRDENSKLMEQAQRNFVNAVLRRESGSAISSDEFDSANKQYFPLPGDTQDVLDQKKRNREVALAGLKTEGAKAWDRVGGNLAAPSKQVTQKQDDGMSFLPSAQASTKRFSSPEDFSHMSDDEIRALHRQIIGGK